MNIVKRIKELETKLEELKNELSKNKSQWKPQYGDPYWIVDLDSMSTSIFNWTNDSIDEIRLKRKLVFKTEIDADECLTYLIDKEKAMNEFSISEWEDKNIDKYSIRYNFKENAFCIDCNWVVKTMNEIYFRTKGDAETFIHKYKKFLKRDLGVN